MDFSKLLKDTMSDLGGVSGPDAARLAEEVKSGKVAYAVINRPLDTVWEFFKTPERWKEWHGAHLRNVEPAWQFGAKLNWADGSTSTIGLFLPREKVRIDGGWMNTTYSFFAVATDKTRLEVAFEPTGGASFSDGGRAHQVTVTAGLNKMKAALETTAGHVI